MLAIKIISVLGTFDWINVYSCWKIHLHVLIFLLYDYLFTSFSIEH